jgi:hypothetical protein
LLALAPFQGFGFVDPFDDGGVEAGEDVADFGGAGAEELAAQVTARFRIARHLAATRLSDPLNSLMCGRVGRGQHHER